MKTLLASVIAVLILSGYSNPTSPSPQYLSFSYYSSLQGGSSANQTLWNSTGTEFTFSPQDDSAFVSGWATSEHFTLGLHGIHSPGTYQFGANGSVTISGAYRSVFATYSMLPGGTIAITAFNNDSNIHMRDYRGTFSGRMVGVIGNVVDTLTITNGKFQLPN